MENQHSEILVKSEKVSQKKKIKFIWLIATALLIVMLISFIIDYRGYRKGQKYGVACGITAGLTSSNSTFEEQCSSLESELENIHWYNITINGVTHDYSEVNAANIKLRETFYDAMKLGGYTRYGSWEINTWFRYTNPVQYFTEYYSSQFLPVCTYVLIIISLVFTLLIKSEAKKELIIYTDSVVYKVNRKKNKEILFESINSVDLRKNSIKLICNGVKFKINNLANAEELKTALIENKKALQRKPESANTGNAVELIKYKELLDSGVISQEEFDAKKKQLLGL